MGQDMIRAHKTGGAVTPWGTHSLTDDTGEDEQPEAQRASAATAPGAEPGDPFPDATTRAPMAGGPEGNGDAPKQDAQKEEEPFPPMAQTQKGTKDTQRTQDADTMSPAGAGWGEPSPRGAPTDAEGQEVAIGRLLQAVEALDGAFQAALDTMREEFATLMQRATTSSAGG